MRHTIESDVYMFAGKSLAELDELVFPFEIGQLVIKSQPSLIIGIGPDTSNMPQSVVRVCGWSKYHPECVEITLADDSGIPWWPYGKEYLRPYEGEDWADNPETLKAGTRVKTYKDFGWRGGKAQMWEGTIIMPWKDPEFYFVKFDGENWNQSLARDAFEAI